MTTFGRSIYLLTKSFGYKYLSLASDGQISPAGSGQGYWLFHLGLLKEGYTEKTISNRSNKDKRAVNLHLKNIEKKLNLSAPLRLETARDCYSSSLKRAGVPTQFICDLMAQSSVVVTENYLSAMNNNEIFDANSCLF